MSDEDLASFQLPTFKLMCPVSYVRIEKPARGFRCKHLQAFDLRAFLEAGKNAPPKRCAQQPETLGVGLNSTHFCMTVACELR